MRRVFLLGLAFKTASGPRRMWWFHCNFLNTIRELCFFCLSESTDHPTAVACNPQQLWYWQSDTHCWQMEHIWTDDCLVTRNVISVLIIPNNYLFLHETPLYITRYNTTISCTKADKLDPGWISSLLFTIIITLVRHKTARFDTKMPGSTPKGTVRHKNAQFDTKMPYPACIIWHCHYQTSSPFLLKLFSNFLF